MHCVNNLKQLGLALHGYHAAQQQIPFTIGPDCSCSSNANVKTGRNWIVGLLPYIEQQGIWDKMDMNAGGLDAPNLALIQQNLALVLCPSDADAAIPSWRPDGTAWVNGEPKLALTSYGINVGDHVNGPGSTGAPNPPYQPFGRNGCTAAVVRGVASRYGWSCSFPQVRDGFSNTLFVGEVVPEWCYWQAWGTQSFATTAWPINYRNAEYASGAEPSDPASTSNNYALIFRSQHPGGAHFLFGDGSVHFLAESLDLPTYQALASRDGGETVQAP